PGNQSNYPQVVMNRWRKEGDVVDVQQFGTSSPFQTAYSRLQGSDKVIEDASFARLKNVSLSWTLSKDMAAKLRMEQLKIFLQCQNLLTLTDYNGLDPESQLAVLPPRRVITAGVHITL